jgi:type III secretion system YseE family protein
MELTALEQQLLVDPSEEQVAILTAPLQQYQQQLVTHLRAPQRPTDYSVLQCQLQAVIAAEQVIRILAQRYQSDYTP